MVFTAALMSFNLTNGIDLEDKTSENKNKYLGELIDDSVQTTENFSVFLKEFEKSLLRSNNIVEGFHKYEFEPKEDHVILYTYTEYKISKTKLLLDKENRITAPKVLTTCSSNSKNNGCYPSDCSCTPCVEGDCTKICSTNVY